jgi:hypothetical protein
VPHALDGAAVRVPALAAVAVTGCAAIGVFCWAFLELSELPNHPPAPCVEYVPETCFQLIQVGGAWVTYRYECGHCAAYGVRP